MASMRTPARVDAALLAVLGSLSAHVAAVELGKSLWLIALGAGFVVALVLSVWKPSAWIAIGLGTPILVVAQYVRSASLAGPTGQALGLAMMIVWSLLSFFGAGLGYVIGRERLPMRAETADSRAVGLRG